VGTSIIRALAKEPRFEKVVCVGRRKIEFPQSDETFNYNKFEQEILPDFDKIIEPENAKIFQGLDIGFYTLGVSAIKVDEATYRKIEYGYASAVGKFAKAGGCQHFHYVSGASVKKDSWFLVGKVKFQLEEELRQLGFPRVTVYRPAGILTNDNSGGMAGTTIVKAFRFIDRWNVYSVEAEMLGDVIVASTFRESNQPSEIFQNSEILKLGKALKEFRAGAPNKK